MLAFATDPTDRQAETATPKPCLCGKTVIVPPPRTTRRSGASGAVGTLVSAGAAALAEALAHPAHGGWLSLE